MFKFTRSRAKPTIIAGPCTAESFEVMDGVAGPLQKLSQELGFELLFKGSFDKANRTAIDSYRGPGLVQAAEWFVKIKEKYGCSVTTDVHEVHQVAPVAEFADALQIPAFLCRQTDLLVAAVETGKAVSVKKGQFLAPENTEHIVEKARSVVEKSGVPLNFALMERGTSFGYGNLVVDMRGFSGMARSGVPIIFDVTHSTQQPSAGKTTGGLRHCAPLLARAAVATGYVDGLFLEVHPDPKHAKSDAGTQLSLSQAEALLRQVVPLLQSSESLNDIDQQFS